MATRDLAVHPEALLNGFNRPTVAAIQGCFIGGALELALASDLRIAADDAWFRFAEITVGLPTDGAVARSWRRQSAAPARSTYCSPRAGSTRPALKRSDW